MLSRFFDLLFAERGVLGEILSDPALQVFHVHVRDHLPLIIGGDIVNFVTDVHVPVNAGRSTSRGISTSGLDQHSNLTNRILLVTRVVGEDLQLRAIELAGPVTLLAGFLRWAQIMDGSRNGPWKSIERRG